VIWECIQVMLLPFKFASSRETGGAKLSQDAASLSSFPFKCFLETVKRQLFSHVLWYASVQSAMLVLLNVRPEHLAIDYLGVISIATRILLSNFLGSSAAL
jgi:predicted neutral ceramidase superfamily lipid hydrolase